MKSINTLVLLYLIICAVLSSIAVGGWGLMLTMIVLLSAMSVYIE